MGVATNPRPRRMRRDPHGPRARKEQHGSPAMRLDVGAEGCLTSGFTGEVVARGVPQHAHPGPAFQRDGAAAGGQMRQDPKLLFPHRSTRLRPRTSLPL